jgi:Bacterial capsule synthesis protein PGA_cap
MAQRIGTWSTLVCGGALLLGVSAEAQDTSTGPLLDAYLQGTPVDNVQNTSCPAAQNLWDVFVEQHQTATNWASITPSIPASKVYVPTSQRLFRNPKRIVMFGDLGGIPGDRLPIVNSTMRNLFANADLVLGNVEAPITDQAIPQQDADARQSCNFHMSKHYLRAFMAQHCIAPTKAVFSVANNHAGDGTRDSCLDLTSGPSQWAGTLKNVCEGVQQTSSVAGPECVAQRDLGATRFVGVDLAPGAPAAIRVVDVGSLKVGVVAWTHTENTRVAAAPGRDNGKAAPLSTRNATWEGSLDVLDGPRWTSSAPPPSFASRKAQLGLDLLIGMPHWDCQGNLYPQADTVDRAERLLDAGFDVVAGAHPAVLQASEIHETADGPKAVFYSLSHANYALGDAEEPVNSVVLTELVVADDGELLEYKFHHFASVLLERERDHRNVLCWNGVMPNASYAKARREIVDFDTFYTQQGSPTEAACAGANPNPVKCRLAKNKRTFDSMYTR